MITVWGNCSMWARGRTKACSWGFSYIRVRFHNWTEQNCNSLLLIIIPSSGCQHLIYNPTCHSALNMYTQRHSSLSVELHYLNHVHIVTVSLICMVLCMFSICTNLSTWCHTIQGQQMCQYQKMMSFIELGQCKGHAHSECKRTYKGPLNRVNTWYGKILSLVFKEE